MSELVFIARLPEDTQRLGAAIADAIRPGDVITLQGDLGAGKTRLVREIVAALSNEDHGVSSPTFTLIQHYATDLPICHIDAYRLSGAEEFLALGAEELFDGTSVYFIEWADRICEVLPTDHLRIEIEATGTDSRQFRLTSHGERASGTLSVLEQRLTPR